MVEYAPARDEQLSDVKKEAYRFLSYEPTCPSQLEWSSSKLCKPFLSDDLKTIKMRAAKNEIGQKQDSMSDGLHVHQQQQQQQQQHAREIGEEEAKYDGAEYEATESQQRFADLQIDENEPQQSSGSFVEDYEPSRSQMSEDSDKWRRLKFSMKSNRCD